MRHNFGLLTFMLVAILCAHGQEVPKSDLDAYLKSCSSIERVLSAREAQRAKGDVPGHDDFTAAGDGCVRLRRAVSSSDPHEIQNAAAILRPLMARLGAPPATPQEQFVAMEERASRLSGRERFHQLSDLAKRAFNAQEIDKAEAFAKELLADAPKYRNDYDYGNAIFYGNFVLGRVAVRRGDLEAADKYLLQSASTPGSPNLDSFGPNMTLAKELLQNEHTRVVLQYFGLCRKFWETGQEQLTEWTADVNKGKLPDFGPNLKY